MRATEDIRQQMSTLDRLTSAALCRRCTLVVSVAELKWRHGWPLRDYAREREMLSSLIAAGRNHQLTGDVVIRLFGMLIETSLKIQEQLHREYGSSSRPAAVSLAFRSAEDKVRSPKSILCHLRRQISQLDHLLLKLLAKRHHLLTSTGSRTEPPRCFTI